MIWSNKEALEKAVRSPEFAKEIEDYWQRDLQRQRAEWHRMLHPPWWELMVGWIVVLLLGGVLGASVYLLFLLVKGAIT